MSWWRRLARLHRELLQELREKNKQKKNNTTNKQTTKNNRERQTTQKDYKDVVRSCREEFRRAEAQIELNLATIVKDDNIHNIF